MSDVDQHQHMRELGNCVRCVCISMHHQSQVHTSMQQDAACMNEVTATAYRLLADNAFPLEAAT